MNTEQLRKYIGLMDIHSTVGVAAARLRHTWKKGFAVEGHSETLDEAGNVLKRYHHTFKTDWPEPFSGDSGPTPGLELILSCVGACAATSFALKASLEGIHIEKMEVITEGKVDLKGLFEVDGDTPARLQDVSVTIHVCSEADSNTIQNIANNVLRTSPVIDSLLNPVSIDLSAKKADKNTNSMKNQNNI
ncbi:MAG: OsmC family protein [Balneolaceae bacterium]|nr:OsmC family protein [Balneolaceae bacterium]